MEIRKAQLQDVEGIIQLIKDRIKWEDEVGIIGWNTSNYLDYYTKDYFKENIQSFYVAEEDKIVGAICLYTQDERWSDHKECFYVHHLVADVSYKGLGKLLLLYSDCLSLHHGYDVIRLDSATRCDKLTQFYSSLGYLPVNDFIEGNYHGTTREKHLTHKYDAVIYDVDGTLVNTFDMNFYPLLQIIKEEKRIDLTIEDVAKYASYPGMKTLEELEIENRDEVYKRWVRYVNEYPTGAIPFNYIDLVLQYMPLKQGIVSSKKRNQYHIDIEAKGLDQYIDAVVLEEDTYLHKPDKEPIELCCKRLGVDVSRVLYIGDTCSDLQACKNAGCDFGYAFYGNVLKENISEANYVFHSPIDILKIFGN